MRREEEREAARKIDAVLSGQLPEEAAQQSGCGFCGMFRRRRSAARSVEHASASSSSNSSSRIFGTSKSASSSHSKLEAAVRAMQVRATDLSDRAALSRAKAVQLAKAGRKADALAELKRAKAVEKQLATANAAAMALEQQLDVLAESELQREVASALSASVKSIKGKTKGLLGKTETAVDDAAEVADLAADMSQVLEGLAPSNGVDEDDIADELAELMRAAEEDSIPASGASSALQAAGSCALSHSQSVCSEEGLAADAKQVGLELPSPGLHMPSSNASPARSARKEERASLLSSGC